MTATTKRKQADLRGARMQPLRSARRTTATRHDNVSMERIIDDGFATVCETYKERHALVVGKRHFCCGSND
jgi:hypothetical protein